MLPVNALISYEDLFNALAQLDDETFNQFMTYLQQLQAERQSFVEEYGGTDEEVEVEIFPGVYMITDEEAAPMVMMTLATWEKIVVMLDGSSMRDQMAALDPERDWAGEGGGGGFPLWNSFDRDDDDDDYPSLGATLLDNLK